MAGSRSTTRPSPKSGSIFHKHHTGKPSVAYETRVDEALCYGWIDSLIKRIDDDRYARKFTPRKAREQLVDGKRQAVRGAEGANRAGRAGHGAGPEDCQSSIDRARQGACLYRGRPRAHARAWTFFDGLAPSHRRMYIIWVDTAKRDETKQSG